MTFGINHVRDAGMTLQNQTVSKIGAGSVVDAFIEISAIGL